MWYNILLLLPKKYNERYVKDLVSGELTNLLNGYDPQGVRLASAAPGDSEEYNENEVLKMLNMTREAFASWLGYINKETNLDQQISRARNLDLDRFDNNHLIGWYMGNGVEESEFVLIYSKNLLKNYLNDYRHEDQGVYMVSVSVHS